MPIVIDKSTGQGLSVNDFNAVVANDNDRVELLDLSAAEADCLDACSPDTDLLAVVYKLDTDNKLYLRTADLAAATPSLGSATEIATLDSGGEYVSVCPLTTTSLYVIYWNTSDELEGVDITDIFGTPSVGTPTTLQTAFSGDQIDWVDSYSESATKVVFAYRHSDGSTGLPEYKVNTITGIASTDTVGTALSSGTTYAAVDGEGSLARVDSDRCIVAYSQDQSGNADFEVALVDGVSDDTLAEVDTQAATTGLRYAKIARISDTTAILFGTTTGNLFYIDKMNDLETSTISKASTAEFRADVAVCPGLVMDDGRLAFGMNIQANGFVGVCDGCAEGETVRISALGNMDPGAGAFNWKAAHDNALVKYGQNKAAAVWYQSNKIHCTRFR